MTAAALALVISTYEQPDYLARVLRAVTSQIQKPDEVILADDGSGDPTRRLFGEWAAQQPFRCHHAWQPHQGFRKAPILNQAIASVESPWVAFLDGDTVPHPSFVRDHAQLATDGIFVQGHRALVEERAASWFGLGNFTADRRRALWTGQLRGLKHAFRWPLPLQCFRSDLRGVRGCNLSLARSSFVQVNGYNEAFEGWGREDSEFAVRLMNSGIRRLDVRGRCLCYHLWHPPASRSQLNNNDALLEQAITEGAKRCERGLDGHKSPSQGTAA